MKSYNKAYVRHTRGHLGSDRQRQGGRSRLPQNWNSSLDKTRHLTGSYHFLPRYHHLSISLLTANDVCWELQMGLRSSLQTKLESVSFLSLTSLHVIGSASSVNGVKPSQTRGNILTLCCQSAPVSSNPIDFIYFFLKPRHARTTSSLFSLVHPAQSYIPKVLHPGATTSPGKNTHITVYLHRCVSIPVCIWLHTFSSNLEKEVALPSAECSAATICSGFVWGPLIKLFVGWKGPWKI